jgi:hypothetical protein
MAWQVGTNNLVEHTVSTLKAELSKAEDGSIKFHRNIDTNLLN